MLCSLIEHGMTRHPNSQTALQNNEPLGLIVPSRHIMAIINNSINSIASSQVKFQLKFHHYFYFDPNNPHNKTASNPKRIV